MTSTPGILAQAARDGLVTGDDVVAGLATAAPLPRSNRVHRVERRDAAVAYVKQPGAASRLDGDDPVAVERHLLRLLSPGGFTPSLIRRGDPAAVWTRVAPGIELSQLVGEPAHVCSAAAKALGHRLSALHTSPVPDGVPRARAPWPLLPELPPSMTTDEPHDGVALVRRTLADPRVREVLAPLREDWARASGWVHGDVSVHNVVVDVTAGLAGPLRPVRPAGSSKPSGPARASVLLVDVEAAGVGDAAWDVVSAVAALERVLPGLGEAFTAAYRAADRAAPGPAWWCVRHLVTAWQLAVHPGADALLQVELDHALAAADAASDLTHPTRPEDPR